MMRRSWNQDMQTGEITETYQPWDDSNSGSGYRHTLLTEKFDARVQYAYLTNVDYDDSRDEYTYTLVANADRFGADAIEPESDRYDGTLTTSLDVSSLYGQKVKVIYKDDSSKTVYGIYAEDSAVLTSGVVGDLPDDLAGTATSMKIGDTTYRFDGSAADIDLYSYNNGTTGDDLENLTGMPVEWAFDPVSYTHLDVYKRQPKGLPLDGCAGPLRTLQPPPI